jgi:flagellar biosynthesis/type III secretory pathway protein FliH
MASVERVLTGRAARHGAEPWQGQAGVWRQQGSGGPQPVASHADPMADPAVRDALAEAVRVAEERGIEAGRAGAEQELAAAVAAARTFAHRLETAVPRDVEMLARTVAELSVLIARRILGAELRHDPSVLVAAIEAGLRQAAGASVINVELHPMVVETVEAVWIARHGTRNRGFSWSFSGDPTLSPDGCRIRTEHGLVEAGFEDQLSEIATAMDIAIPGYLVSALGPTKGTDDDTEAVREPVLAPAMRAAPAAETDTLAAVEAPSLFGAAAGVPDDLDLEALTTLGLDELEGIEGLEVLALGSGGTGEAGA